MVQEPEGREPVDIAQLRETHHLGNLLTLHFLSRRAFFVECLFGFVIFSACFLLSLIVLLAIPYLGSMGLIKSGLFSLFFLGVGGWAAWLFVLDARRTCLLICEGGLIEVTSAFGEKSFRVLAWENIKTLRPQLFGEYKVSGKKRKESITLAGWQYQQGKHLIDYIKTQVAEAKR